MAALIAIFLAALLLSFGFAFAAPWLVIVPIAIVMVFAAWLVSLATARRTPQEAVRRTKRPQLLGPGGPDDPEA
jgi:NADH:ubiquinone oxidoreductase subunit 6 (subunit J)